SVHLLNACFVPLACRFRYHFFLVRPETIDTSGPSSAIIQKWVFSNQAVINQLILQTGVIRNGIFFVFLNVNKYATVAFCGYFPVKLEFKISILFICY